MNQVVKIHKIENKRISIEEFDEGKSLNPTTTKKRFIYKDSNISMEIVFVPFSVVRYFRKMLVQI